MLVEFHGLQFDLPPGWADITDELGPDSPPTLARPNGHGVIQFSIGRHTGGAAPNATTSDLLDLSAAFCRQSGLEATPVLVEETEVMVAMASGTADKDFVAAWHLSNGQDFVLMTYLGDATAPERATEFADAVRVASSMRF